jgi:hypothetical protein
VRAAVEVPPSVTPLAGQGNLLVSFPISARGAVEEAIVGRGASGPVALLTELDPEADALAVYRSGQKGPAATRAGDTPVSRLAGTFVLFVYATESDSAKLYEDGFTVSLKEASRRALAEAVAAGKDLRLLGGPGSLSIRVRWRD